MKTIKFALFCLPFFLIVNCGRHANTQNESITLDEPAVADTGFTGIKQYFSAGKIAREVSFKNGVQHGYTKTFYAGGTVRQAFWYENNIREDSSKWYYESGKVFRSTPYTRDTIHGTQVQYYSNGRVKAKIGYEKGLRTFLFEEYTSAGKLITNYPEVIVKTRDNYNTNGTYNISVELSDAEAKVDYFRGDFSKGVYDTAAIAPIRTINNVGNLTLRKSSSQTKPYVEILASILTGYGNRYLLVKRIDLPYNDLN